MTEDLFEIIQDNLNEKDPFERLQYLIDIRNYLRNGGGKKLAERITDYIEDHALEEGLCPSCGAELEIETWHEPRPYGSTVAYEELAEAHCPNGCM
ncbi:MAG TPA: hypothetical protein GXX51_06880 [Firmicutes bacterium]|nr:hypothetical protein [Bacillota bacterium]